MRQRPAPPTGDLRPLDPNAFSFHGFDDAPSDLLRGIARVGIRGGEPTMAVVEDALFVPTPEVRITGRSKSYGGVFAPDGQPIDLAQLRRKGRSIAGDDGALGAAAPARALDEEIVYLGPLFNHFGRVLLESLARVWVLAEVDPSLRVVFDYPNSSPGDHDPWVLPILALFGIPPERLLVLNTPTRLRRAIVPEPLFEQHHAAHEAMVRPFREVAARLAGDVEPSPRPVYLSRRRLTSRQRPIVGEEEIEDLLRGHGFLIAHPQTMTFEDQVRLANGHAHIFSGVGSAAHNLLFARHRPALHLLTSGDNVPRNFLLCSALAEAPTAFIDCLGTGGRPGFNEERQGGRGGQRRGHEGSADTGGGTQSTPQVAEVAKLAAYLADRGFPPARPAAAQGAPKRDLRDLRDLRDRYDEAWLYARLRMATRHGRTLPPPIEREATELAPRSWPVSWMLARYYATDQRNAPRAEELAAQFAELAAAEPDPDRLAYYRSEIQTTAVRVRRMCGRDTARRLDAVLADRFRADPEDTVPSSSERRGG